MSGVASHGWEREYAAVLAARLAEPGRLVQAVTSARQVGKTTLVQKVLARRDRANLFITVAV